MAYSLAKPRGAADRTSPDGRVPLPLEGPGGGVATEDARRSERLIGNCQAGGHGQAMCASRGGLPIGPPIWGYHHGTTHQAGNRHRARRREVFALGVRGHSRGRASGKQACFEQENAIDGLYAQYPGALVFVNQVRNIGSLALSRARLAGMPRQGHAARQGREGRGEEAAQGDLRGHEGQGSVRSLTAGGGRRPSQACISAAENAHRKDESLLTEL